MITISENAQQHFQKLIAQQEEANTNIRVFVANPGTPHAECGVSFCPPSAVEPDDEKFDYDGFATYIDPQSLPYLENAEIDFKTDDVGGQLTLKAPYARTGKVDDDAPLFVRIRYVLESEINPQLASHGGMVSLIELTDDNEAILQFGGGCQGCGMADMTLKHGVEKTLKERFPELTKVVDSTDHASGENPYFQ